QTNNKDNHEPKITLPLLRPSLNRMALHVPTLSPSLDFTSSTPRYPKSQASTPNSQSPDRYCSSSASSPAHDEHGGKSALPGTRPTTDHPRRNRATTRAADSGPRASPPSTAAPTGASGLDEQVGDVLRGKTRGSSAGPDPDPGVGPS
ncbi:hypothetical protein CLAIMM_02714, partial [Cladophialophora immunda]